MIQKLGQICEFHSGNAWKASKFKEEGIPIIRINNMKPNATDFKYWDWEEEYDPKYFVNEGDILVSLSGTIKTYKWVGEKALLNQRIVRVTPKESINIDWVYYQISNVIERISDKGKDAVIKNVSVNELKKYEVEVPDFPSQNKIVALLDKASELVQKRDNSIDLLNELLRAQFLEMFGDPVMANKHDTVGLKFYLQKIQIGPFGSQLHRKDYIKGGIPLVNPVNIIDNKIFPDNTITLTQEKYNSLPNYHLNEGDIVMARRGEMGRCGLITEAENNWFCGTGSLYLRPKNIEHSVFLLLALTEFNTIEYLNRNAKGVTMKNLNKTIISNIPIIKCEDKLILKFNSIYQNIQSQKETLIQSKTELENLYNSLLQRAFSGQLNFNVDAELDVLLAAIDVDNEQNDIRDIATVYASRLLERLESQDFENQTQYQQAKQVAFQMLKEGAIAQEYDTKNSAVKMKLV
jgi:type I restriction enzyme S subunit